MGRNGRTPREAHLLRQLGVGWGLMATCALAVGCSTFAPKANPGRPTPLMRQAGATWSTTLSSRPSGWSTIWSGGWLSCLAACSCWLLFWDGWSCGRDG